MHDIRVSTEQLRAAAAWAEPGEGMDAVGLSTDKDGRLLVTQGDEFAAFAIDGTRID